MKRFFFFALVVMPAFLFCFALYAMSYAQEAARDLRNTRTHAISESLDD